MQQVKRNPNLNDPDYLTVKAERIKIGGHISHPYSDEAVMMGSRGEKGMSYALPTNGTADPTQTVAGSVPPLTI